MADGTYTTTKGTGTGTGAGGIAAKAKAEAKARAEARAAKAKAEAEDLAEARRIAAAAVYGGEEAWARLPGALRRDLLAEAWLLMHAPAEERAKREKRQRAACADPALVPLESTLKNQWRNEREKAGRQRKILAFGYVSMPREGRDRTLIVTSTNTDRQEINRAIRSGLELRGDLGPSVEVQTLRKADLTGVELRKTSSYTPGQVVEVREDYKRAQLARWARWFSVQRTRSPTARLRVSLS